MRANGYEKRGAGIAGKEKMPWFSNVDDLMKALNSKYEPVMHIVEGENLKVEDFRNQKFRVHGVTLKVDDIRAEYPIFVENGKARTDFFLKLYGDCDDEHHEVLIHFPHEKQQQGSTSTQRSIVSDALRFTNYGTATRTTTTMTIGDL